MTIDYESKSKRLAEALHKRILGYGIEMDKNAEFIRGALEVVASEAMAQQKERDAQMVYEDATCTCSPEYLRLAPNRVDPACIFHNTIEDLSRRIRNQGEA